MHLHLVDEEKVKSIVRLMGLSKRQAHNTSVEVDVAPSCIHRFCSLSGFDNYFTYNLNYTNYLNYHSFLGVLASDI